MLLSQVYSTIPPSLRNLILAPQRAWFHLNVNKGGLGVRGLLFKQRGITKPCPLESILAFVFGAFPK
jgi:hypothetical protein